jgi:hypothetical protein
VGGLQSKTGPWAKSATLPEKGLGARLKCLSAWVVSIWSLVQTPVLPKKIVVKNAIFLRYHFNSYLKLILPINHYLIMTLNLS